MIMYIRNTAIIRFCSLL